MRAGRVFQAVDSHTEGMPTRVITGGVGVLPGDTMLERKLRFERERDWTAHAADARAARATARCRARSSSRPAATTPTGASSTSR